MVTGASRGYGSLIANALRSNKRYTVYTVQRAEHPGHWDGKEMDWIADWIQCDFSDPSAVLPVVERLNTKNVVIEGLVHAVGMREPKNVNLVSSFDIQEHIMVNVLNPLMLTLYMFQFNRLEPKAKVIWLLDRTPPKKEVICYHLSKYALPSLVKPLTEMLADVKLTFITLPPHDDMGEDDMKSEQIARYLASAEALPLSLDMR
jgi:short-subunit dehydrogenase